MEGTITRWLRKNLLTRHRGAASRLTAKIEMTVFGGIAGGASLTTSFSFFSFFHNPLPIKNVASFGLVKRRRAPKRTIEYGRSLFFAHFFLARKKCPTSYYYISIKIFQALKYQLSTKEIHKNYVFVFNPMPNPP